ncbi:MAG: hypothetical protein PHE55_20940 [Methylococcaceae bacterium]|nr:hypothetical protein [Methylococcaceae bacterium]
MKSNPPPFSNIDDQASAACDMLKRGSFKDAIGAYKELLKRERRQEWEQGLAQAYQERALQVGVKGMHKEAIVFWENQTALCPETLLAEAYLGWLVQVGQFAKLANLLGKAAESPEQGQIARRLPEALAIMALENDKLLVSIPKDHPIAKHRPIVKQALTAYAAKRDEEVEECLRQIPSRSPYRNLRTLLKASLLMDQDRAAAVDQLDRIDGDSVCRKFAHLLQKLGRSSDPGLADYFDLTAKQQAVINKLNGYDKTQLSLLKDAKKLAHSSAPRLAFEIALNHRGTLGESACRRFCFASLVDYPQGMPQFERAFGKLPAFEHHRLDALHAEQEKDLPTAAMHWRRCLEVLGKKPVQDRDKLDEALILRHIAQLASVQVPEIAIDALEDSLELDPDDKESYLDLIRLYEKIDDPKAGQECLEKGLKRYPKDVDLLLMGMNAASRRKAFKKAVSMAKTLLEIDPINSQARQLLIAAHLGHARKQFRTGRLDRAKQELEQARPLDPHRRNASLCIMEGILALREGEGERAARMVEDAWRIAGGGLCARFLVSIEALILDQPLASLSRLIPGLSKAQTPDRQELMGLAKLIDHYGEEKKRLTEALSKLKPLLKKGFKQEDLSEEDYFNLCQSFAQSGQFDLLAECARAALLDYPFTPGPIYFEVLAKCKGVARKMGPREEERLEVAMDHIHRRQDERVRVLIDKLFRQFDEAMEPDFDVDFPLSPFGDNEMDMKTAVLLTKRMLDISAMSREELIQKLSNGPSGLPLKKLATEELRDLLLAMTLEEQGFDMDKMGGTLFPFGLPGKPSPKLR